MAVQPHRSQNGAGFAETLEELAKLSRELGQLAADRVRIESLYGPHGAVAKLEQEVDRKHEANLATLRGICEEISTLKGYVKWGAGALTVGAALIGWAISSHRL